MNRAFDRVAADLELGLGVLLPEQALVPWNGSFLRCKTKLLNSTNARASPARKVLLSGATDKTS